MKIRDVSNIVVFSSNSEKSRATLDLLIKKNSFLRNIKDIQNKETIELIVVVGGDGTLLRAIKSYMHLSVPFFGINTGTVGFLMNDLDENSEDLKFDVLAKIQNCKQVKINPLNVEIKNSSGELIQEIAINELSILRDGSQSVKFNIYINNKIKLSNIIADGAIVATPAGSSAYNFSAGGVVLPLSSNAICLTPICAFRPRNFPSLVLQSDSVVKFEINDLEKRPVKAFVDFNQIDNISEVVVKDAENKEINLLLDCEFENKSIREQLRFCEK